MTFRDVFGTDEPDEHEAAADEEEHERPPWLGPPEDELGVALPQTLVLGRSDTGVVALSHVLAFADGATFHFHSLARGLPRRQLNQLFHEQHVFEPGEEPGEGFLRIGVELADGERASNLAGRAWRRGEEDDPAGPVFTPTSGGGGSGGPTQVSFAWAYWLWPLPPPGPLRISCEWPVVGIELSTAEIDASSIVAASGRASRLWS
jgi:hypothetical protein